jgi:amino acid adenylation domain-containing protein
MSFESGIQRRNFTRTTAVASSQQWQEEKYWLEKLSGEWIKSQFPYDHKKKQSEGHPPAIVKFRLPPQLTARLLEISNHSDVRLHMALTSGLILLIHKYTDNHDIIVGMPIYKQEIKADFINTVLALRTQFSDETTFKELLFQVKQTIIAAVKNQNYPMAALLYQLGLSSTDTGFPLFDIALLLENIHDESYLQGVNVNIRISFCRTDNDIQGQIRYNPGFYAKTTIQRINEHFFNLLQQTLFEVNKPVSHVVMLSAEERRKLLVDFNSTEVPFPNGQTIHGLFEQQVEKSPDAVLITGITQGEQHRVSSTYREINQQSQQLAALLIERGVTTGTIVSIMMERSIEMAVGILGILKARGAYMPIDPDYPRERIDYMLADSSANLLVTTRSLAKIGEKPVSWEGETILLGPAAAVSSSSTLTCQVSPANLAYIIYTSGSTGRPKGVMIDHHSVVNTLVYRKEAYKMNEDDASLQLFSFAFDGFVTSFFTPIISGSKVVVLRDREVIDPVVIKSTLVKDKITHFISVPSLYQAIIEEITGRESQQLKLKVITLAGDQLSPHLLESTRQKNKNIEIAHEYGVTESAVMQTIFRHQEKAEKITIGKPIWNTRLYIVNRYGHLQPIGIAGELGIAGKGLARGYINNPELTAEKFCLRRPGGRFLKKLPPWTPRKNFLLEGTKRLKKVPGKRFYRSRRSYIYRTGDLARWFADGNIEFLGRIDHQVKVRGFRIELEEIENQLITHDQIKDVKVIDRQDDQGQKYLCAYVVFDSAADKIPHHTELREYLSYRLPDYMIPSYFVPIEKIPLTFIGKINRKELPEPEITAEEHRMAPRNDIERKLVFIWSEVLNLDKQVIGINTNFFDLGGHSLKATLLTAKLHKELNVIIPLDEIFKNPTIIGLAEYIKKSGVDIYTSIEPVEKKEYCQLSSAQKRLYILQQIDPGSTAYNMSATIVLDKTLDINRLVKTFKKLIHRHESLRTSFVMVNETPVQQVHDHVDFLLEYFEMPGQDLASGSEGEVEDYRGIIKNFARPFDLTRAPLLRVGVISTPENYILLVDMHHIISDGVSMEVLEKEFYGIYSEKKLLSLKLQYKDYARWQNSPEQQKKIKRQETYWLNLLLGELPVLDLPQDYPRPALQGSAAHFVNFLLEGTETQKIKNLVKETDTTLYMVILSLYNIWLSKLNHQEDIIIGTPIAARRHWDLERIIGMFVNTLVMRNFPLAAKTFKTFLKEVKNRTLDAYENQEYQFEDLVDKLSVRRDTSRNPIFDVMFNFLDREEDQNSNFPAVDDLANDNSSRTKGAKFDLNLRVFDYGQRLLFNFEYSTALFKKESIKRFTDYFRYITACIISNPVIKLADIEVIPDHIKKEKIKYFNEDLKENAAIDPIQLKLAAAFQNYKQNTAIEYGTTRITYEQLESRAAAVSMWLTDAKIEKESFIGIYLEDKIDIISAVIGILKARCVFVPLDTKLPIKRVKEMLRMAGIQTVFTDAHHEKILTNARGHQGKTRNIVVIDPLFYRSYSLSPAGKEIPEVQYHPADKIYIYFTSGTSGRPNAILGKNESLVQFIQWEINTFAIDETYRVSQLIAVGFDAFLRDVFVPLFSGGTICIPNTPDLVLDHYGLVEWIDRNRINLIHCVPGIFRLINSGNLTRYQFQYLNYILMSGEAVNPAEVKQWYKIFGQRIQLVNFYGPTETTKIKTFHFIRDSDVQRSRIPAGFPMRGARAIILDRNMNICAPGITGEIYIRTPYGSFGYLDDPELTAERFIKNPFTADSFDIIYKTGDLGRELVEKGIEIIARVDRQVKIRGVRIEPGEIESQLLTLDNVQETVVIPRTDEEKNNYLCAYIVAAKDQTRNNDTGIDLSAARKKLTEKLPDYMIPAYFVQLEKMPLTSNGKIDKNALPEPRIGAGPDYIAPRNPLEKNLVKIWTQVLKVKQEVIGIDSNFFHLGGHSLKATILAAKIHKELEVKVPLAEIFKNQTIRELSGYITAAEQDTYASVQPVEKREYYELSSAQKRLYILQQITPESTGYNMHSTIYLEQPPPKKQLEKTFKELIKRHETFRTSFEMINEKPVQRIHDHVPFEIEYYNTGYPLLETEIMDNFVRPFDLSGAPLLRVGLVTDPQQVILLVDMHHIISDAISNQRLKEEFLAISQDRHLPGLRLQYKDYALWQNSKDQQVRIKKQETYWLKEFSRQVSVLNLAIDYTRPAMQSFAGNTTGFALSSTEAAIIKKIAKETDTTFYMVILSLFNILLAKLSGQDDVIVGTPIAARRHEDLQRIIGMFVNTLAMRNFPSGHKTWKEFLTEVKERSLEAFDNQEYQFEDLVDQLSIERDLSRNPLFDVMFNLLNQAEYTGKQVDLKQQQSTVHQKGISKVDITLTAIGCSETFYFIFEYCTKLFRPSTIDRFIQYFRKIILAVGEAQHQKIWDIDMIAPAEKNLLLHEFNNTQTWYPKDKTVHELIEEQAEKTPDHTALVGQSAGEERSALCTVPDAISYRELHEKSQRLADVLRRNGVKTGTIVGLMSHRSPEMIIGLLAILKAGGCYLPIDPGYPDGRIKYMLEDSGAGILVTQSDLLRRLEEMSYSGNTLDLYALESYSRQTGSHDLEPGPGSDSPIYLEYTSGSTGKPKGVMIEHRNVVNFMHGMVSHIDFSPGKRILALTTICFDIFVLETWVPLARGLTVVIVTDEQQKDPELLAELMMNHSVNMVQMTPSTLKMFTYHDDGLRCLPEAAELMIGGEQFPDTLFNWVKVRYSGKIYNLYGPTETTVWSAIKDLTADKEVTIGCPIANTSIYILDRRHRLQPLGVVGELYIGGDSLARGYLNQPELTAEKFCLRQPGGTLFEKTAPPGPPRKNFLLERTRGLARLLYYTGDLARWLPEGNLQFSGRIDHQVKIRGIRIELSEIESQLLNHGKVKEAVVILKDNSADKYLCAYIVTGGDIDIQELQQFLSGHLPDYMLPSYFVELEKIPLTSNGKINRNALPEPEMSAEKNYIPPRDEIQKKLVEIWAEVLAWDVQQAAQLQATIGINDNFFNLGGHSLKATILASKIHKELNVKVPLAVIFKTQTIIGLAGYIKSCESEQHVSIPTMEKKEYYELSPAQMRLYMGQKMAPATKAFNMIDAISLDKNLDSRKLEKTIRTLIHRHESLRTAFMLVDEQPVQKIHDSVDLEPENYDLAEVPMESEVNVRLEEIQDSFVRPFDLNTPPLLRVGLIRTRENNILLIDMHHIISDGASHQVLKDEFRALFAGQKLPALRLQYKDYARWQNSPTQKEVVIKQEKYWLSQFETTGEIPVLNLPTDYPRPDTQSFEGSGVHFEIDKKEARRLKNLAANEKATIYTTLLAFYYIFLAKLSGNEDIVVGTVIEGRRHTDLEKIVGMFVNVLALRNFPTHQKTFRNFLNEVNVRTIQAFDNQDYQFDDLVKKTVYKRYPGWNPLYDVGFLLQVKEGFQKENSQGSYSTYKKIASKVDMTFQGVYTPTVDRLLFIVEYSSKLFKKETIESFTKYFKAIVSRVLNNPDIKLEDIEIMPGNENLPVISEINGKNEELKIEFSF